VGLDSRVFFLSILANANRALATWLQQGSADYQTVYRPLIAALGGSGYLQDWQILNHALGLDNAESRVNARINASNLLRVAGRQIGLDVRRPSGEGVSTPMRPLVGRMVLAALANDAVGFAEARRDAVAMAREEHQPDPEKSVARAFEASHPLRAVFRTAPTVPQYAKILAALDDAGRAAVQGAVAKFNAYADQIGAKAFTGRTPATTPLTPWTLDRARSLAAGGEGNWTLQEARRLAAGL